MKQLILLLCVLLFVGCSDVKDVPKDDESSTPIVEKPTREVLDVPDLNTLIDIFYNNELDGNKKYFSKWIKTSALFDEIDHSWLGDLWVYFDVKNANGYYSHYGILCTDMSKEEKNKVSNFNKGMPVVFIGYNQGILGGSRIEFKKCEFPDY